MGVPLSVPRRTLTVDEYRKISAAGVFREDDRIELIEGELVIMAPIGGKHLRLVNVLSGIWEERQTVNRRSQVRALVAEPNPQGFSDSDLNLGSRRQRTTVLSELSFRAKLIVIAIEGGANLVKD
jgi:hypothetical protein